MLSAGSYWFDSIANYWEMEYIEKYDRLFIPCNTFYNEFQFAGCAVEWNVVFCIVLFFNLNSPFECVSSCPPTYRQTNFTYYIRTRYTIDYTIVDECAYVNKRICKMHMAIAWWIFLVFRINRVHSPDRWDETVDMIWYPILFVIFKSFASRIIPIIWYWFSHWLRQLLNVITLCMKAGQDVM